MEEALDLMTGNGLALRLHPDLAAAVVVARGEGGTAGPVSSTEA